MRAWANAPLRAIANMPRQFEDGADRFGQEIFDQVGPLAGSASTVLDKVRIATSILPRGVAVLKGSFCAAPS